MTTASHLGRHLAIAAGSLMFAACSDDDPAPENTEPAYVALLDGDSQPDQVRVKPVATRSPHAGQTRRRSP